MIPSIRVPLILAALSLAITGSAQSVRLKATQSGKDIGEAYVNHKVGTDGGKTVSMRLELRSPTSRMTVRQESYYDSSAKPTRAVLELLQDGGKKRDALVVNYDGSGAKWVHMKDGQSSPGSASLVQNVSRAVQSEFWFVRDLPEVGTVSKSYVFNLDIRDWEYSTVTYLGPIEFLWQGKKVPAHRVKTVRGDRTAEAILDERGLPLKIEDSKGLTLERIAG